MECLMKKDIVYDLYCTQKNIKEPFKSDAKKELMGTFDFALFHLRVVFDKIIEAFIQTYLRRK